MTVEGVTNVTDVQLQLNSRTRVLGIKVTVHTIFSESFPLELLLGQEA